MQRKGQIALFLIIGVVLIAAAGITFFLISKTTTNEITNNAPVLPTEIQPVQIFIESCIEENTKEAIKTLALRGWYNTIEQPFIETHTGNIPVYLDSGTNLIPSKGMVESEITEYLNAAIPICILNAPLSDLGFEIKSDLQSVSTTILGEKLVVDLIMPTTIKNDKSEQSLNQFHLEQKFNYQNIEDITKNIVDSILENPGYIDLTLLKEQKYSIMYLPISDCADVFFVYDNQTFIDSNTEIVHRFGVYYNEIYCTENPFTENKTSNYITDELDLNENLNPTLSLVPFQSFIYNQNFIINLSASDPENETLFYFTNSVLENLTDVVTGTISTNTTTEPIPVGIYKINATVVDISGGSDWQEFNLEIK